MSRKAAESVPKAIERVRVDLAAWRSRKRGRERIPEKLWVAAAAAARKHGVYKVSRTLGLDYSDLKRRTTEGSGLKPAEEMGEPVFVELDAGPREPGMGCVVQLEKGNGTRMRICVRDAAAVDWCRMKEAFLGG